MCPFFSFSLVRTGFRVGSRLGYRLNVALRMRLYKASSSGERTQMPKKSHPSILPLFLV